jgi:hypothetical protein
MRGSGEASASFAWLIDILLYAAGKSPAAAERPLRGKSSNRTAVRIFETQDRSGCALPNCKQRKFLLRIVKSAAGPIATLDAIGDQAAFSVRTMCFRGEFK